jgi:hypothetical protein
MVIKTCEFCKKEFKTKNKLQKSCSKECRIIIHSKMMKGHKPFNYKGGKLIHKGYVYLLTKGHPNGDRDGYVTEHRLVMEKFLNRFLDKKEVVHHINGIRNDNRIENLELIKSQSEHMKIHYPEGKHFYKNEHPRGALGKRWKILGKKYPHRNKSKS